jgi:aminodeoxyfutalosine deaminase
MIIRADTVITNVGAPISDGAVVIDGNTITAVCASSDIQITGPVLDLGKHVLMPGLVNAHCHLDFTMMRSAISPQRTFTDWIRRINALKRSLSDDDYRAAIAKGFAELRKWGTTTVANIESFPELLIGMEKPPIRTWWFFEMIDVRHRETSEDVVSGAMSFFEKNGDWLGGFGLSPHAPYTASGRLFELTAKVAQKLGMRVTAHVAESHEEWQMFKDGSGAMYDFLLRLGRWMYDCHHDRTPLAHVAHHGCFDGEGWLLAHMNELDASDFALLASLPPNRRPSVVHCPNSHRYFSHNPFPMRKLMEIGIPICLGTDSLASTDSLSLFEEMRTLAKREPWLGAPDILQMATCNGAAALGLNAGKICVGAVADLIALPYDGKAANVYDAVLAHREPITWMMLNGQIA